MRVPWCLLAVYHRAHFMGGLGLNSPLSAAPSSRRLDVTGFSCPRFALDIQRALGQTTADVQLQIPFLDRENTKPWLYGSTTNFLPEQSGHFALSHSLRPAVCRFPANRTGNSSGVSQGASSDCRRRGEPLACFRYVIPE